MREERRKGNKVRQRIRRDEESKEEKKKELGREEREEG